MVLNLGPDRARKDGDQHSVRVLHEGQQVCLQNWNPFLHRKFVETNVNFVGQHACQRRTKFEKICNWFVNFFDIKIFL